MHSDPLEKWSGKKPCGGLRIGKCAPGTGRRPAEQASRDKWKEIKKKVGRWSGQETSKKIIVETNEEKWKHTHIGKWSGQKGAGGAIISETNIWQTHKRNESSHIENDPASGRQMKRNWRRHSKGLQHPAEQSSERQIEKHVSRPNGKWAKASSIQQSNNLGVKSKGILNETTSKITQPGDSWRRRNFQMTFVTTCFTRKKWLRRERWNFKFEKKKKREPQLKKPRKKNTKTATMILPKTCPLNVW